MVIGRKLCDLRNPEAVGFDIRGYREAEGMPKKQYDKAP